MIEFQFLEEMQDLGTETLRESKLEIVEFAEIDPTHWNAFPNIENVDTCYNFDIHVDRGENMNWMVGLIMFDLRTIVFFSHSIIIFLHSSSHKLEKYILNLTV